jgi:hypothetical protein
MRVNPTRKLWITAIVMLVCALALAACDSSSKKPGAKPHADVMITFSKCMRAHGVTNFPDPSGGGGGLNIAGTGINPRSPVFRAAQTTCFKLLPGGGPANHHASAQQIKQATESAECMRMHGVTGFPDPTIATSSGPPDLNPANYGSVEDDDGIIIAIPKAINEQSPVFVAAAKTCKFNG